MSYKIYIDLDTLAIIAGVGDKNPVLQMPFKRGIGPLVEVVFLKDSALTPTKLDNDNLMSFRFGVKPKGKFDADYWVIETDWTIPTGDDTSYFVRPIFDTVTLNTAFNINGNSTDDPEFLDGYVEIYWKLPDDYPTKTLPNTVARIFNDVNRGDESTPATGAPPADVIVTRDLRTQNIVATADSIVLDYTALGYTTAQVPTHVIMLGISKSAASASNLLAFIREPWTNTHATADLSGLAATGNTYKARYLVIP